ETSFPNPQRIGCPAGSLLKEMAYRVKSIKLDDLPISHINSCSPCFREYMAHRIAKKRTKTLWLLAGSLAALILLGSCIALVRSYFWVEALPSLSEVPVRRPSPPNPSQAQSASTNITIDLARFSHTRSEPISPPNTDIRLPAKAIRAKIAMPVGSEPGEYAMRLVSPD